MTRLTLGFLSFCGLIAAFLAACGDDSSSTSRLETRATIEGRIVLAAGAGLNDVSRLKVDIGQGEGGVAPNEDGSFRFGDLEADVYTFVVTYNGGLVARAEGSAYQRYEQTVSTSPGSVTNLGEIRLALGLGSVAGTLSLDAGDAAAGTVVRLRSEDEVWETTPGADGRFLFEGVPVARYQLTARRPGYSDVCAGPEVVVGWDAHAAATPPRRAIWP